MSWNLFVRYTSTVPKSSGLNNRSLSKETKPSAGEDRRLLGFTKRGGDRRGDCELLPLWGVEKAPSWLEAVMVKMSGEGFLLGHEKSGGRKNDEAHAGRWTGTKMLSVVLAVTQGTVG